MLARSRHRGTEARSAARCPGLGLYGLGSSHSLTAMRRRTEASKERRPVALWVMLAAAGVLSVVAGFQVHGLWRSLPGPRLERLYRKGGAEREAYLQELRRADASMSAEAREALCAVELSGAFTAALFDERVLSQNRDLVQARLNALSHTRSAACSWRRCTCSKWSGPASRLSSGGRRLSRSWAAIRGRATRTTWQS